MKIMNDVLSAGELMHYDDEFRIVLDSHMRYLRTLASSIVTATSQQAWKYRGDYFGLLQDLHISSQYHYVIMRFNKIDSPMDYDGLSTIVELPDMNEVDLILGVYKSKKMIA